jgi:uracil-DNA glycosylase
VAPATDDVIAALDALREEVECCSGCVLADTRTRAVFGEGDPGADLMFVGEAPGYHEDQQGRPFVGQAGRLLEQLLASIGLTREQVYIANVLKSRPPNNRDPRPEEIEACRPYLFRQIEIIRPKVICTLGNFATKLLSGDQRGITQVHGQPRVTEIAGHELYLFPIFHPAAALYTPANLATLKEDFLRLPELLAHAAPQPVSAPGRPAWRPPAHLQTRPPASATGASAATLEDVAPAAVDATRPAEGTTLPAAPPTSEEAPPTSEDAPPTSEDAPPVSGPDRAEAASAESAPASPPARAAGPTAGPEQLGLF